MTRLFQTLALGFTLFTALDASSALANCKPGTPHCVTASNSIPKFCGSVSKPCTIDGGLGSTCKGGGTCGTGPTGPEDNPYFPYNFGNERTSGLSTTGSGGSGGNGGGASPASPFHANAGAAAVHAAGLR